MKRYTKQILIISTVLSFAGIFITVFVSIQKTNAIAYSESRIMHIRRVLSSIEKAELLLVKYETDARDAVLTGEKDFITMLNLSAKDLLNTIDTVAALTKDNLVQSVRVDTLELLINKQIALSGSMVVKGQMKTLEEVKKILLSDEVKYVTTEITRLLARLAIDENAILSAHKLQNAIRVANLNSLFWMLFLLTILAFAVCLFAFRQTLRIKQLHYEEGHYLSKLILNVPDAVFSTDEHFVIKSWNKGAERIYGWTAEEAIGQTVNGLLHTDYGLACLDTLIDDFRKEGYFKSELIQYAKSGELLHIMVNSSALYDINGNLTGAVSVNSDITKQKQQEAELFRMNLLLEQKIIEKNSELSNLFERVTDACIGLDTNWCFTYMNSKAGEIMQCNPAEVIGKFIWSVVPEAVDSSFYHAYYKAFNEQDFIHIEEYYPPYKRWFEANIYPSPNGLSVFFRDITNRKKAEETARISNERYNIVAKATNDSIWDWDLITNNVIREHKHLETFFGYKPFAPDEIHILWAKLANPEDWKRVTEKRNHILHTTNESYWEDEYRFKRQDGSFAYVLDRGFIIRDSNGSPIRMIGASQDISERKEAERLLKQKEEHFRALIENGSEIIAMHDAEGKILYMSPSVSSALGYLPEERIGRSVMDAVHPDDKASIANILTRLIANPGNSVSARWRQLDSSNHWRWMEGIATNLLHDPSIKAVVHNFRDITRQKEAENKILLEKELSESIIDSLPGIFYLFDEKGKFMQWNANLETVSGYSEVEITQMHPLDFFAEDEKLPIAENITRVFSEGKTEVEAHLQTKQGQKIPYYFNGRLAEFEGKKCLIGMGIDISNRKKAEAQLKLLESVITNTNDSVVITKAEPLNLPGPEVVYVNHAFTKMTGYTPEEVIGKTPRLLQGPKTSRTELNRLKKAMEHWEPCEVELINYKKTGEEFWINFSIVPVADENGWFTHWISIERDITERKAQEAELQQKNRELKRLSAYLQNIRENERKYIAREVHDELGQLASAIKIDVDWFGLHMDSNDPPVQKRMDHANKTIAILISSIRKIASQLRPSILDDFGLNAAIEWQCKEFQNLNGIQCIFINGLEDSNLSKEVQTELFRMVQESLTNVMRHAKANRVEVKLTEDEDTMYLSVADDGKGFDTIQKRQTLGLVGLRERAISINGQLQINSEPGKGTTVLAQIPKKNNVCEF